MVGNSLQLIRRWLSGEPSQAQIQQQIQNGAGSDMARDKLERNKRKERALRFISSTTGRRQMELEYMKVAASKGKKR